MRGNKLFKIIDKYVGIPLLFLLGIMFRKKAVSDWAKYPPQKILIIKLSAMGDTVLLIPSLRALRQNYPRALIKMIVTEVNKEIIQHCPYIDGLIYLDLKTYLKHPLLFLGFMRRLRQQRFTLALDFDQWLRLSPLLAFFSGAKQRVGFKTRRQGRHYVFTQIVEHSPIKHEVECFFDLVKAIKVKATDRKLDLWIIQAAADIVNKKLSAYGVKDSDLLIGIHPGCGSHGQPRQWPPVKYLEVIRCLQERAQAKVIVTGGLSEKKIVEEIVHSSGANSIAVVGWDLQETVALIKKFKVLVCGNTGIMHIATAVGTPVVALHGPTNAQKWGPWGDNNIVLKAKSACSPCLYLGFEYGCKDYSCMSTIEVEEVLNAVLKFLDRC